MAEHRPIAACEHRSKEMSPPGNPHMADGERLPVKSMEAPRAQPALGRPAIEPVRQQLAPPDHAVLAISELGKLPFPHFLRSSPTPTR